MCQTRIANMRKMSNTDIMHFTRRELHLNRNAIQDLINWKSSKERKPMVLKGARQVGKTWLMKEFGQNYYNSFVYFNFDEVDELKSIFETNKNPYRIIDLLSTTTMSLQRAACLEHSLQSRNLIRLAW